MFMTWEVFMWGYIARKTSGFEGFLLTGVRVNFGMSEKKNMQMPDLL